MKTFLAVYLGTQEAMQRSGWNELSGKEREERDAAGVSAWMEWGSRHAGSIVDPGAPLGRTKRVSAAGIADTRNALTGYAIVRAESHEEAARMFEKHPHFSIFPGEAVEIVECLPMP